MSETKTVTFKHAFRLPGMNHDHQPGTFEVQTSREPIDVMWEAYHVTTTLMLTSSGITEAVNVSAADLETALIEDRLPGWC